MNLISMKAKRIEYFFNCINITKSQSRKMDKIKTSAILRIDSENLFREDAPNESYFNEN